ncbi:KIN17-like protein [Penicillium maclennaniae]|uniref:KIN17-like protein n=1 Tax=Penicillium maclennaniae TaxID=1343394 RepID=UPI002540BF9B|nr:KIN17-like protein [Penicillium maclennaniae]KAJ5667861.1 KIN17-like protein [Penicillium maclennaniae]
MPRAEAGSTKAIGNKIKAKGLGRLRWYCQACERQMRDENGFKCHVASESHVRQMLIIGEDARKHIQDFSKEFQKNFVELLRTTHGEKKVHINHFYQQVIADKEHIHMNATQWKNLSQFAAHLGREGICRVEETEKGLFVSWIDNSPETMRKREAIMKKERQDKGDEEREQRAIKEQIQRAQAMAKVQEEDNPEDKMLQREDGEKVTLNFGFAAKPKPETKVASPVAETETKETPEDSDAPTPAESGPAAPKISMSFGAQKPKNVFASAAKKNPLAGRKGPVMAPQRKMTEQERIMKAEMEANERKRSRPDSGFNNKRPKISLR